MSRWQTMIQVHALSHWPIYNQLVGITSDWRRIQLKIEAVLSSSPDTGPWNHLRKDARLILTLELLISLTITLTFTTQKFTSFHYRRKKCNYWQLQVDDKHIDKCLCDINLTNMAAIQVISFCVNVGWNTEFSEGSVHSMCVVGESDWQHSS